MIKNFNWKTERGISVPDGIENKRIPLQNDRDVLFNQLFSTPAVEIGSANQKQIRNSPRESPRNPEVTTRTVRDPQKTSNLGIKHEYSHARDIFWCQAS